MGAPTGCRWSNLEFGRRSYVDLVSFCARCNKVWASGQYTCRSVPQTSCAELARYTASPGVCDRTGSQVVQHSSIQSAQNRSKLFLRTARNPTRCIPAALRKCPVGAKILTVARDSDQVSYTGDRPFGLRQLVDFWHIRQKACDTLGDGICSGVCLSVWMIYDVLILLETSKYRNSMWCDFPESQNLDTIALAGLSRNVNSCVSRCATLCATLCHFCATLSFWSVRFFTFYFSQGSECSF